MSVDDYTADYWTAFFQSLRSRLSTEECDNLDDWLAAVLDDMKAARQTAEANEKLASILAVAQREIHRLRDDVLTATALNLQAQTRAEFERARADCLYRVLTSYLGAETPAALDPVQALREREPVSETPGWEPGARALAHAIEAGGVALGWPHRYRRERD